MSFRSTAENANYGCELWLNTEVFSYLNRMSLWKEKVRLFGLYCSDEWWISLNNQQQQKQQTNKHCSINQL